MQPSVSSLLKQDQARLAQALDLPDAEARVEAQILLCHALGATRAWLLAHAADHPEPAQLGRYQALLQRRLAGEPVAYILGKREFYGLEFKVTPAVLIPRPETELLVELALARIPPDAPCRVLDLGTGSGAVAIAIARHRPEAHVTAVDRSPEALDVARKNAEKLEAKNVRLLQSDWFDALAGKKFGGIVSNPPYIAENDPHLHRGDLRFEPAAALASGADGLDAIRQIVAGAPKHLEPGGWLLFEHGYDQAERCRELMAQGGFQEIATAEDLAGIPRVTFGRRIANPSS
ncbi:MAG: peptide chain release factor N(5)-glutamine methyltransferase [Pseudomonadota bacterium]